MKVMIGRVFRTHSFIHSFIHYFVINRIKAQTKKKDLYEESQIKLLTAGWIGWVYREKHPPSEEDHQYAEIRLLLDVTYLLYNC